MFTSRQLIVILLSLGENLLLLTIVSHTKIGHLSALDVFRTPLSEERDLMRSCQELWSLDSRKITNAHRE